MLIDLDWIIWARARLLRLLTFLSARIRWTAPLSQIKTVFNETLFGPAMFRGEQGKSYNPEDFDESYPSSLRPDFAKEFAFFRGELTIEKLITFSHFHKVSHHKFPLGVLKGTSSDDGQFLPVRRTRSFTLDREKHSEESASSLESSQPSEVCSGATRTSTSSSSRGSLRRSISDPKIASGAEVCSKKSPVRSVPENKKPSFKKSLTSVATISKDPKLLPNSARVEIYKSFGGTEYIIHDIDDNNHIIGRLTVSGHVSARKFRSRCVPLRPCLFCVMVCALHSRALLTHHPTLSPHDALPPCFH